VELSCPDVYMNVQYLQALAYLSGYNILIKVTIIIQAVRD